MEASTALYERRARASGALPRPGLGAALLAALALVGPVLIAVPLALDDGGYALIGRSRIGLLVWWLAVLGVALGVGITGRPFGRTGWIAAASLGGLATWTLLSALWSSSPERSLVEAGLAITALGAFVLATLLCRAGQARRLGTGIGLACTAIILLALGTRFFPGLAPPQEAAEVFPGFEATLSFPFNYPSALGAAAAITVPLLLHQTGARTLAAAALAAAAIPAAVLVAWLTGSAQALPLCALGALAYVILSDQRAARLATVLVGFAGGALLIVASHDRGAFELASGGAAATRQGHEMLALTITVAIAVAAYQVAIALAARHARLSRTSALWRRARWSVLVVVIAAALVAAAAWSLPDRVADGWQTFKGKTTVEDTNRASQITDLSGQNRYQYWSSAVRAFESDPLTGIGAGTFEYWWARDGSETQFVRDAHSLAFQTLAELGLVGAALLAALLITVVVGGAAGAIRCGRDRDRSLRAAAVGGALVFCASVTVDWTWEFATLTIVFAVLAALAVAAGDPPAAPAGAAAARRGPRWALAALGLAAMVAIYVPFAAASALAASKAAAGRGDSGEALEKAREAARLEPFAAAPELQEALILEGLREFSAALGPARQATENEPENWRNWLILSRINAEAGHPAAAVAAYRRARTLNPRSPIFE